MKINSSLASLTSKRQLIMNSELPPRPNKRLRCNFKSSSISDFDHIRFQPPLSSHIRVKETTKTTGETQTKIKNKRQACLQCSIIFDHLKGEDGKVEKLNGEKQTWDKFVKGTVYTCSVCGVYLCDNHFHEFHKDRKPPTSD